jgi:hypothetical protein
MMGGTPHFGTDSKLVYLIFDDGLHEVRLDGSADRLLVKVTGPGWYFVEGRAPADDLRVSPDGHWVLAQFAQQLHLLKMPPPGTTIDIAQAGNFHRQLTDAGADFFAWGTAAAASPGPWAQPLTGALSPPSAAQPTPSRPWSNCPARSSAAIFCCGVQR